MKIAKTIRDFECALLSAFKEGMIAGYGISHENIHEEELNAALAFCERHEFRVYGKITPPIIENNISTDIRNMDVSR